MPESHDPRMKLPPHRLSYRRTLARLRPATDVVPIAHHSDTARFILVPSLRDELTVPVPADRGPGKKWTQGPEVTAAAPETTGAPIRIGYARCSTATQELQSQLDALAAAHCTRVFSEKISTRIKIRPELEKALTLAHEIKTAAPDQPVILTVHEMKRLARNAAERSVPLAALW